MLKSSAIYFALVFGVGFILGVMRTLWLVPRVGVRTAELMESPLMLLAILIAAHWVTRRFCQGFGQSALLGVGIIAALGVLATDLVLGMAMRGMSPADVFLDRDPVAGIAYYALIVVYALMPWLMAKRMVRNDRVPEMPTR